MKVGIFGGTFNPPHNTHIEIARAAKEQLSLDKLIVVPCGIPPHKHTTVSSAHRLEMARRAFCGIGEVSDFEINKQGKSYTVETFRHVKDEYPNAEFFLIMGGDSFHSFSHWYCPEEIARLATIAVVQRADVSTMHQQQIATEIFHAKVVFLDFSPTAVSSTEIRLRYQFGMNNTDAVPQSVDDYVKSAGLYAEYLSTVEKLKTYLDEKRLCHTFYVVKRGLEIANGTDDLGKVFLACLLHDCAKNIPESDYAKYGFAPPADMPKPVMHSFLGARVAEADFGVTDQDVLSAIAYHTTGCPNMSRLQKIVYVADKTEQSRPYPLEHLLKGSLDDQLVSCLEEANSYTAAHHGTDVYPLTQETLAYYCKKSD